jgi:hypothetical protein
VPTPEPTGPAKQLGLETVEIIQIAAAKAIVDK